MSTIPTPESLKEKAKVIRKFMKEKCNADVSHGHSLELISKIFDFKDWNTASALSAKADNKGLADAKLVVDTSAKKPIAAKLQKAGVLSDFFSKFDRETDVYVYEYKWEDLNPNSFGTVTSVCSLTYDYEIQRETELILELNTEKERNDTTIGGSHSATQTFERTSAGRSQRRIKFLELLKPSTWNPKVTKRSDR